MISVIVHIEIQQEDKRIVRIQAIGDNGTQYQVQEEVYTAGRPTAVKQFGVICREKGESDKQFALRMLQKVVED